MRKLRILDDFNEEFYEFDEDVLKREAIRHIKSLREEEKKEKDSINKTFINGKINWIKYFFNITDKEDLKWN